MTNSSLPCPSSIPLTPRADPLASSFATSYAGVVAFIAVVAEGSFARAADRLGIGRSAVSRSVQKLEDQLNVRLFTRTTRSTTLTHGIAAIGRDGYRTQIEVGSRHRLVADEPPSLGGADTGPAPYDLLIAALGACTKGLQ